MSEPRTLDVSHLVPYDISNQAPLWWGQVCIAVIEGTMFSLLIAGYFYVRLRVDAWPPPGDQLPDIWLLTLALIPLILSAGAAYWATEAAKKNDRAGMIWGMASNLVLAMAAFVMRIFEWHSLNFNWQSDSQGSYVWAFLGLHSFDYVAGMVETLVLLIIILSGRYGEKQRQGVHVDSVVWYFVVGIWIPIYVVIYWGPRLLGSSQ
jgi:cytochrome c oxidase subunit I+III